jgi:DNA modification methylase
MNTVHNIDFLNNDLPDKCANLIIADPPYYKVKGDFDFIWKTFEDYLADVEKWAIECKRLLADNGTLLWYGDLINKSIRKEEKIKELMTSVQALNTELNEWVEIEDLAKVIRPGIYPQYTVLTILQDYEKE